MKLLAASLAAAVVSRASAKSCVSQLASGAAFTTCTDAWTELKPVIKPTQSSVGYAWVEYKVNKDFTSEVRHWA
jgi:hypothetical protein